MTINPNKAPRTTPLLRMLSCIKERRAPDTLLAFIERQQEYYGPAYYRGIQNRLLRRAQSTSSYRTVQEISSAAFAVGRDINMDGIVFGPAHWEKTGELNRAPLYYHFLAGFIKSQRAVSIVEIGTWYGGSTLAMQRGFDRRVSDARIVTIDPNQRNLPAFVGHPEIIPIEGDAANDRIVEMAAKAVSPRIDILFIDGDHRYAPTKAVGEVLTVSGGTKSIAAQVDDLRRYSSSLVNGKNVGLCSQVLPRSGL